MKEKIPFALSVAILCFLSVWICCMEAVAPFAPVYAVFLFWGSYFCTCGGVKGLKVALISHIVGAIWAFLALAVILPLLSFAGTFALPLTIFIAGGAMVLESAWEPLSFVPGVFCGCATCFAIANSSLIGPLGNGRILLAGIISAIVGDLLGVFSAPLAGLFTKKTKQEES